MSKNTTKRIFLYIQNHGCQTQLAGFLPIRYKLTKFQLQKAVICEVLDFGLCMVKLKTDSPKKSKSALLHYFSG